MLKLTRIFIWIILAVILFVAIDQVLLHIPMNIHGINATQRFYVDFRRRLIRLIEQEDPIINNPTPAATPADSAKPATIDTLISDVRTPAAPPADNSRYLYVDAQGNIQFADSLSQVPPRFRESARKLAQ